MAQAREVGLTSGGLHDHLVEGEASAASLGDAGAGRLGEAEGGDRNLGHVEHALVISDGADNDDGAVLLAAEVLDDLAEGKGRPVGAARDEAAQDGLGEVGASSACQEAEQLHTKRVNGAGKRLP